MATPHAPSELILVNTSVISSRSKNFIIPWTILQLLNTNFTIFHFFTSVVKVRIAQHECELQAVHVGQDMNSLCHVLNTSLPVFAVIRSFGHFL